MARPKISGLRFFTKLVRAALLNKTVGMPPLCELELPRTGASCYLGAPPY